MADGCPYDGRYAVSSEFSYANSLIHCFYVNNITSF